MKKKLTVFGVCAALLAVALVVTFRVMPGPEEPIQPEIEPVSTVPSSASPVSVPPIKPLSSSSSEGQKPLEDKEPPQENSHIVTTEEDGSITDETVRPEFSKPEVPDQPPELAEGSTLDDPNTPPEYISSSSSTSVADGMDKSLWGKDKTENGVNYTYVPGFGWVAKSEKGNTQYYAPNAGTGEVIGH